MNQEFKEARNRWSSALKAIGLPDSVTPDQLDQLNDHCENMLTLRRELDVKRSELDQRRRESETLHSRLRKLADETETSNEDDDAKTPADNHDDIATLSDDDVLE